jgi:hypothetical protein
MGTLAGQQSGAVSSRPCNGDLDTVETPMSPLAHAQRIALRQQQLNAAQMAHLRQTAYRGVDTTAHQPPNKAYKPHTVLTYRGQSYSI